MVKQEKGMLSIESNNIFTILKKWLYTEPDIVFRELISNATDAVEKLKLLAEKDKSIAPPKDTINVTLDAEKKTLTISDNGIGMDQEEVEKYINNIAFSGAEDYISQNQQAGNDSIIGHFGIGFYSAFMMSDHVAIETKSYKDGAQAIRWDCTSDMAYTIADSNKESIGTDVILYLSDNNPYLQKPEAAFNSIKKYFDFSRYNVYFTAPEYDNQLVNNPDPIWRKAPEDISEESMNAFYKEYFKDSSDPLFWLQFSSMDIGVRGIIFFRNTRNGTADLDGTMKVYSRGVYVGDNVPQIITKFVNLQSGIIECDNLPLMASRSQIHDDDHNPDEILALISECLIQEITIKMNDMFVNERSEYEKHWPELNVFVKYGVLQDKTFASVMTKKVIFENIFGDYQTIEEYLASENNVENNELAKVKDTVYYSSDKLDQAQYIDIFRKSDINALLFDHVIDQPFLYKYELIAQDIRFTRIDSNIAEVYGENLFDADIEHENKLINVFENALGDRLGDLTIKCTRIDDSISAIIVNDEETRRIADMMEIYGYANRENAPNPDQAAKRILIININNPMISIIESSDNSEYITGVVNQVFDLALLSQQALEPEDMVDFIKRSGDLLEESVFKHSN